MKQYNFSAGPAILSSEVLNEIADSVRDYKGSGLSLLELSHRGKAYDEIAHESLNLLSELLGLPDNYHPLYLWGGATALFSLIPFNVMAPGKKIGVIDTGVWSTKAIKAASYYGEAEVIASSADKNYSYIPKNINIDPSLGYVHLTSNNTIFGTQFHQYPNSPVPVIADFSSDIFSRPVDINQFDLVFASAQKNLGPAGTVAVAVKDDLLERSGIKMPDIFNFKKHIERESRLNTPPVISIYGSLINMRWIKRIGLDKIAADNQAKATALYEAIDKSDLFSTTVAPEDRSIMNVTFRAKDETQEPRFLKYAEQHNIVGIKGHRLSGGFRASIYNAMDLAGVQYLISVLEAFEKEEA